MPTILTDAEILAMDGPTLTHLAYELGLAPDGLDASYQHEAYCPDCAQSTMAHWHPHEDVQQAREICFDRLTAHGWFFNYYVGHGWGRIYATLPVRIDVPRRRLATRVVLWGTGEPERPPEPSEALALLRCACLTVALLRREEATP